ncbi:MAG: hypothetical protein E7329_04215 [Clostridiales bacterium]|nr:hypothetical protein [Clostridiales bacterium]
MLVNTKEASRITGLSEYELRRGYLEGKYPALVIGRGDQRRRLRWNMEALQEAIQKQMGMVGG